VIKRPDDANDEDEDGPELERPLEPWELRAFRKSRRQLDQMLVEYKFTKKLWGFMGKTSAWGLGMIAAVYAGKDIIWKVLKAVFQQ
jgi:hypothetical protein